MRSEACRREACSRKMLVASLKAKRLLTSLWFIDL